MNPRILSLYVFLMIFLAFQVSCKQEVKTSPEKIEKDIPASSAVSDESDATDESRIFTMKSGKTLELKLHSNPDGLFDFHVIPKGFEFSKDTMIISDSDPLTDAFLADLDKNGFEELYLVTTSGGSGTYGNIHGYSSNADKSITPAYLRPINENDLAPGEMFEGYMGHDSIFLDKGKLMRKFPVYMEGDPNCCPTGGTRLIEYKLVPGEATWTLQGQIHAKE